MVSPPQSSQKPKTHRAGLTLRLHSAAGKLQASGIFLVAVATVLVGVWHTGKSAIPALVVGAIAVILFFVGVFWQVPDKPPPFDPPKKKKVGVGDEPTQAQVDDRLAGYKKTLDSLNTDPNQKGSG